MISDLINYLVELNTYAFLAGGGKMGELARQTDWSTSAPGVPAKWPISLATSISLLLRSKSPMALFWGESMIQFFNDAYRQLFELPDSVIPYFGKSAKTSWGVDWNKIEPEFTRVLHGETVTRQSLAVPPGCALKNTSGFADYNFVNDDLGFPAGVFVQFTQLLSDDSSKHDFDDHRKQLLASFEQSPVAIAIIQKEGLTFTFANKFYGELVGRNPEDIIHKPLLEALPEIAGQGFDKLLDQVISTGKPFIADEAEVMIKRRGELQKIYVDLNYQPYRNSLQEIFGVFAVVTDVTEKVISRREVEASNEKFRSLITEAPFATALYTGPDLIIDIANDAMLQVWGKTSHVLGMPLDKALPELQGQPFLDLLHQVRTTGVAYKTEEQSAVLEINGSLQSFWFNFSYKPLFSESGEVYGILNMAVDITEQVKARQKIEETEASLRSSIDSQRQHQEALEEIVSMRTLELARTNDELHKSNELLQQSNEELTQYAYVASHDLQEPLRKIRMFSSMLSNSYGLPPEVATTIGKIERSAGRMSALVKDLLEFSQLLKSDVLVRHIDLNQIIQSIISDLELVVEEKSATFVVDELPKIEGVEQQITQLFYNLIGNAMKFCPVDRSPRIEINCSFAPAEKLVEHFSNLQPATDYHHILVKDNGIGFDPVHREQIFEIFKRLHGHTAFSGTGIGLALCRRIVENHKGKIFAESRLNEGSVFHILLPAIAGRN